MKKNISRAVVFVSACALVIGLGEAQAASAATGLNAGIFATIDSYNNITVVRKDTDAAVTAAAMVQSVTGAAEEESTEPVDDGTICGYTNLGIAQVESSLNVRKEPDISAELVGKMQNDAGCEILEQAGDWYRIKSGKVEGYVSAEYIITGDVAAAKAEEVKMTIATVTTQTLNVRAEMNTECTKLALMPEGEELEVTQDMGNEWVQVDLDGDLGYVHKDYVEISTQLPKAQTLTELRYGEGVSNVRVDLVSYALQFVGNRYVWGGTSLTNGVDCSGFTMQVMAKYGVYLPHYSVAQASCGTRINASEALPGDLFFYSNGSRINHVAIYIGNGQIVHASSPSTGIKISNAYYRSPVCVTRVLGN